jgi:uncharacterized protein YaiE (UPF0345 family)
MNEPTCVELIKTFDAAESEAERTYRIYMDAESPCSAEIRAAKAADLAEDAIAAALATRIRSTSHWAVWHAGKVYEVVGSSAVDVEVDEGNANRLVTAEMLDAGRLEDMRS